MLQLDPFLGIEGRQVVEENLVPRSLGRLEVDRFHLEEGEVPLGLLRGADLAGNRVPRPKVEPPDLRRRDVDVIRTGKVVVVRRPEESEPVRQDLEDALAEDHAVLLGLGLKNGEYKLLFSQTGRAFDAQVFRDLSQLGDIFLFQFNKIHQRGSLVDCRFSGGIIGGIGLVLRLAVVCGPPADLVGPP